MAMLKTSKATVDKRPIAINSGRTLVVSGKAKTVRAQESVDHMQKVTALDPDYSYHHVIGLHGDQRKGEKYAGNDNGDFFWWNQTLCASRQDGMFAYETWRGGDVLENHDENSVRGHIADVWPVFADKSIDMLMATKRASFEQLVGNIDSGKVTDVSMGTIVGHSYCSVPGCHRHASKKNPNITEEDWCEHLQSRKGAYDPTEGVWIYEDNRDIFGVECSWITFGQGADSTAKLQMKVASLTDQQRTSSRIPTMDRGVLELFGDSRRQKR
jgi:hypothetical protein